MDVQGVPELEKAAIPLVNINGTIPDHSEEETKELQWASPGGGGGGGNMLPGPGISSPGGSSSSRPKTMKEFEEELIELRRDNFDLRMRIYLLEEQDESAVNLTSLDPQSSSRLPPSFAQLKELYISNSHLKEEIASLKKQLSEKEELVLQAASAVDILEKNQVERLNQIKLDAEKECQKLQDTISQLTQEVMELKMPNLRSSEKSVMFDDSNAMYAMAFGLPLPNKMADKEKQDADDKITGLELKLSKLEKEMEEENSRRLSCDDKLDRVRTELKKSEDSRRHLADELKYREAELAKAHKLIEEKCQAMTDLQDKLQAKFSKPALDSQQTEKKVADSNGTKRSGSSLNDFQEQLSQLREQIKSQKLENIRLQGENMKAMRTIQGLVKHNKALTRDLEHYKSDQQTTNKEDVGESSVFNKDNRITELETEVSVLKEKLSTISFGLTQESSALTDLSLLRLELESKNCEIENLNEELKKRTFNLQELVNKELWDKNREIEKLNQTLDRKQVEFNSLRQELSLKNHELIKLQEELKKSQCIEDLTSNSEHKENTNPNLPLTAVVDEKLKNELKISIEDNNKLKEEIECLNKKFNEQSSSCLSLKEDCKKWRESAEESEKNRKELINACTLLTTRLEELSTFLESLLPLLGSKKRRMLQQAIDRSREMSRSFSFMDQSNLSISIPLLPDVSQVDFCSGDETLPPLGDKAVPSDNDEVARLRNQVESLVERLRKKETTPEKSKIVNMAGVWSLEGDERLEDISEGSMLDSLSEFSDAKRTPVRQRASLAIVTHPAVESPPLIPPQHCLSESDGGWSEPDRNVSKERIGIRDVTPQKPPNSSEESVRSNRKSPSVGKKTRNEGLMELKRLSTKLDSLEQMNEALHAELQVLHRSNVARLDDNMIINKPNSPKSLREIVNIRRRSLEKSVGLDSQYDYDSDSKCPEINELSEKIKEMSVQLESSCRRCLELEEKCFSVEGDRKGLELKLAENEDRIRALENELEQALSSLREKDNYMLERQCALLEANNNNILLNAKLETITENLNIKQEQLEKYERESSEKDEKAKEMYREMEELRKQSEEFETQLKSKLETCQHEVEEAVARRLETERRLIESYELQTELRTRLDQEILRSKDLENQFKVMKELEHRIAELEALNSELEAAARCRWEVRQEPVGARSPPGPRSPTIMRSPTMPCCPSGLRSPIGLARSPTAIGAFSPPLSPTSPRSPRHTQRLLSNPSSDYVSDQDNPPYQMNANFWISSTGRCNNNCSPDLGIESDNHSLAAGKMPSLDPLPLSVANGDVSKLEAENEHLRMHLFNTRKALANTLSQLTSANQKKRQVERAICKQIHKTHSVLQKAKVNFEQENHPPTQ